MANISKSDEQVKQGNSKILCKPQGLQAPAVLSQQLQSSSGFLVFKGPTSTKTTLTER